MSGLSACRAGSLSLSAINCGALRAVRQIFRWKSETGRRRATTSGFTLNISDACDGSERFPVVIRSGRRSAGLQRGRLAEHRRLQRCRMTNLPLTHFKHRYGSAEAARLLFQRGGGRGGLFHQRGVLLRHAIHLGHRRAHGRCRGSARPTPRRFRP